MHTQKVIVIVGPTASGKSSLGVYIAQKFGGEVISADSRQVYRDLNIGTGKVTKKEMAGIPHHLLDVASPKTQFSADDFVRLASQAVTMIYHSNKIPIVVGGTGFYVDALLGRVILPNVPPNKKLRKMLEKKSASGLFVMLKKLDSKRAKNIDSKNHVRLIRAIEIAVFRRRRSSLSEGKTWASGPERPSGGRSSQRYNILWLGLNPTKEQLHKNIRTRLFARIRAGMITEVKRLHTQGLSYKRMEALGLEYRYMAQYLQKKISKEEFLSGLEREIRRYAKRQYTWFKRNKEIHWVNKTEAVKLAKKFLSR